MLSEMKFQFPGNYLDLLIVAIDDLSKIEQFVLLEFEEDRLVMTSSNAFRYAQNKMKNDDHFSLSYLGHRHSSSTRDHFSMPFSATQARKCSSELD